MSEERLYLPPPVNLGDALRTVHESSEADHVYVQIGRDFGHTSVTAEEFYEDFSSVLYHELLKTPFRTQLDSEMQQREWLKNCLLVLGAEAPFKEEVLQLFDANQ